MRKIKCHKLIHLTHLVRRRRHQLSAYADIWEALYPDDPAEAARCRYHMRQFMQLNLHLEQLRLSDTEAATLLHLPLSRIRHIRLGKPSRFSTEELQVMSTALGLPTCTGD